MRKMSPLAIVLTVSGVLFLLFLVISGVVATREPSESVSVARGGSFFGGGTVAVVELNGVIMDSRKLVERLHRLDESSGVQAVVLRMNSPGGSVAPSQEIYEAVKGFHKPLVVSMASVAASGAYYVACGAKKIFADPGTLTGSIGVIMEFADLQKLLEWAKIKRYVVKTGKFKDVGAEYRDMTPEERSLIQNLIDDVLKQFKRAVAEGRHLSMAQVDRVADGRIFSGTQAKAAHLIDELGSLQDAVDEVAHEAKISGKPTIVYPGQAKPSWTDLIFRNRGDGSEDDRGPGEGAGADSARSLVRQVLGQAGEALSLPPGLYWLWNAGS